MPKQTFEFPLELSLKTAKELSLSGTRISISTDQKRRIDRAHETILTKLKNGESIYGVNTGFGPMVVNSVESGLESRLQHNLVHQLDANVGPVLSRNVVRLILALRINALSRGVSGIRSSTLERLIEMYNSDLLPIIQKWGSVGASGDLVPLSKFARALSEKEKLTNSEGVELDVQTLNNKVFQFEAKEALAIVNGTSFSLGIVSSVAFQLDFLLDNVFYPSAARYLELLDVSFQHLDDRLYKVKHHASALKVLRHIKKLLPKDIENSPGVPQPPYSSRSIVLWLGAVEEKLTHARSILEIELNSVDDNPLVFNDDLVHGANFQGTYVAHAAELLTSAIAGIANLIERQINRILHKDLNGKFPAFLADEPVGLNSGLQGYQLLATSLLADIKSKSIMHSAFSISTNQDNQDIVSMCANAANNLADVFERLKSLLAVYTLIVVRAEDLHSNFGNRSIKALLDDFLPKELDFMEGSLGRYLEFVINKFNQNT